MSKKVDISFMKFVTDDAEWKREIEDCGDKQICSARRLSSPVDTPRLAMFCLQRVLSWWHPFASPPQQQRISSLPRSLPAPACSNVTVVDVYTNMWGPCEMIAGHFNNFFYDLGEVYGLKFVRAACDKVTCLKEYHGESQPIFLFYLGGQQVEKVMGCNLPAILDTIKGKGPKL